MKHTGIIRRMDDIGRVAIPKEIRRTLFIHEGDAFEIVVDGSMIGLIPYQPTIEISNLCDRLEDEISLGNFSSSDTQELYASLNRFKSTLRTAKKNKKEEEEKND